MINVCILGNGTVGSGVVELLSRNREYIRRRTGEDVNVSKVLVKNLQKHSNEKYFDLITNDINDVLDSDADIVVEAMGGLHPAYDYIKSFLEKKKHVITANKDVIAKFGGELAKIADVNGVGLRFEASVAGGIPILKPLQECLAGNSIEGFYAILNGTTNFILSKMYKENMEYGEALKIAQELGFAEANPNSDVLGYDSARKLAILSTMSYDKKVDWEELYTEGITDIDDMDISCARNSGHIVKLLAISAKEGEKIYSSVRPAFLPVQGKLGTVSDEFNGILLEGDAVGKMFFYGKGAGKLPTASAVLGDIFDVIENKNPKPMYTAEAKAEVLYKYPKSSRWFIKTCGTEAESTFKSLSKRLDGVRTLEAGEGPEKFSAFIVKAESEEALDNILKSVSETEDIKILKKIIVLDI